jgi:DNA repair protein RadC
MNLTLLDREQLEAIVLAPPVATSEPLHCSESAVLHYLPTGGCQRSNRLRHALAAAHELLVRAASTWIVGRSLLNQPSLVKDYLKVHFAGAEAESFVVLFLDVQLRVIAVEELFTGTLTQTSVYPREVVKRALHHNAARVVLAHDHPSSNDPAPSSADRALTQALLSALSLIDVVVLDHVVVGGNRTYSFAECGLL